MTTLKTEAAKIFNETVGREVLPVNKSICRYGSIIWKAINNDGKKYFEQSVVGFGIREDGDFVRHEHYAKLEQRLAVMREALENIISEYNNGPCSESNMYDIAVEAIKQSESL